MFLFFIFCSLFLRVGSIQVHIVKSFSHQIVQILFFYLLCFLFLFLFDLVHKLVWIFLWNSFFLFSWFLLTKPTLHQNRNSVFFSKMWWLWIIIECFFFLFFSLNFNSLISNVFVCILCWQCFIGVFSNHLVYIQRTPRNKFWCFHTKIFKDKFLKRKFNISSYYLHVKFLYGSPSEDQTRSNGQPD